VTLARHYLVSLNLFISTIAATDLNFWCFNTVGRTTNGLSICKIIFYSFFIKR